MDLIQEASKLDYKHYTEFTIEELDKLPLNNSNKQIEYYFIQKWLREKHNIDIYVRPSFKTLGKYIITLMDLHFSGNFKQSYFIVDIEESYTHKDFDSYEEALEKGLYEALKLI